MTDKSSDKCISLNRQEVEVLNFILDNFDLTDLNEQFGGMGMGRGGGGYLIGCRLADKVQSQLEVTAKPASALSETSGVKYE